MEEQKTDNIKTDIFEMVLIAQLLLIFLKNTTTLLILRNTFH